MVGHGLKGSRPAGSLPVYTTNNKEEAVELLRLACQTNSQGEYIAQELAYEQTMENLQAFSERLDMIYTKFIDRKKNRS